MALKTYDVEVNGMKTTLRLSEADAKKRGITGTPKKDESTLVSSKTTASK